MLPCLKRLAIYRWALVFGRSLEGIRSEGGYSNKTTGTLHQESRPWLPADTFNGRFRIGGVSDGLSGWRHHGHLAPATLCQGFALRLPSVRQWFGQRRSTRAQSSTRRGHNDRHNGQPLQWAELFLEQYHAGHGRNGGLQAQQGAECASGQSG